MKVFWSVWVPARVIVGICLGVAGLGLSISAQAQNCRDQVLGLPFSVPRSIIPVLTSDSLYSPEPFGTGVISDLLAPEVAGGKRLRPLIALLSAQAQAHDLNQVTPLVVIPEMIHQCSLLVDDWIDEQPLRRGNLPLYRRTGEKIAILVAIAYQADMFAYATRHTSTEVVQWLRSIAHHMTEAEILQQDILGRRGAQVYSDAEYQFVALGKSGRLFGGAAAITARHFGVAEVTADLWDQLGQGIGVAYQIRDDFSDAVAKKGETWRPEINYALRKHAELHGTRPLTPITKVEMARLLVLEQPLFRARREALLALLMRLKSGHQSLTEEQETAFDTLNDIIEFVSPDVPPEVEHRLNSMGRWEKWVETLTPRLRRLGWRG